MERSGGLRVLPRPLGAPGLARRSQRGYSILEVLIAVTIFGIVFLAVNQMFVLSAVLSRDRSVYDEVVRQANNTMVLFHLKDSPVYRMISVAADGPPGWTAEESLPPLRVVGPGRDAGDGGAAALERSCGFRMISGTLFEVRLTCAWKDDRGKPRTYELWTVMRL